LINGVTASTNVLASIDRNGAAVTANNILITGQNLSVGAYIRRTVFTGSDGVSTGADVAGFALNSGTVATPGTGRLIIQQGTLANRFAAGDNVSVTIAGKTASYTVMAADIAATSNTNEIVAIGLKIAIESLGVAGLAVDYDYTGNTANLTFKNSNGAGGTDYRVAAQFSNVGAGGLGALAGMDISTAAGATAALSSIETLISTSVSAASSFATTQGKIETQQAFVNSLADSLKTGIGAMIDTDMEEASARLQALQVQQQLSTQALSISNQQSQSLLSLFR
jgi:flagellin